MPRNALCVLALACALASGAAVAQTPPAGTDPVVATVNGQSVFASELETVRQSLPPQYRGLPAEVIYPAIIDRLIDAKLLAAAGREEKIQNDAEVKRRIALFEERVIQEIFLNQKIAAVVTEDAIKKRYDKFVKENPPREQVSARHILLSTEADAKQVIADLKKGAKFDELAKTKSIDPAGRQQGGDLGFFSRDEMVSEFSDAAFKLKDGQTTEAPVRTQYGWHVIKVESRRTSNKPFEEIQETLVSDMTQEVVSDIVGKLRQTAKIEKFNPDGSKLAPPAPPGPASRGTLPTVPGAAPR